MPSIAAKKGVQSSAIDDSAKFQSPLASNAVKKHKTSARNSNNSSAAATTSFSKIAFDEKKRRNALFLSPSHTQSPKALPSTKISASPLLGDSLRALQDVSVRGERHPSINAADTGLMKLAVQDGAFTGRKQLDTGEMRSPRLLSIVNNIPLEQMTSNFEEWMKIAADNKINAKNSWSLALIDYFSDMTLFREGDSINFQKASCTLDGCVKIYTSRVDSVADETGRLLNGLVSDAADGGSRKNTKSIGSDDGVDEEMAVSAVIESNSQTRKKKPQTSSTLEKTPENLSLKRAELEASKTAFDPLFRRYCSDIKFNSTDASKASNIASLLSSLAVNADGLLALDADDKPMFEECSQTEKPIVPIAADISAFKSRMAYELSEVSKKAFCPALQFLTSGANSDVLRESERLSAEVQSYVEKLSTANIKVESYFSPLKIAPSIAALASADSRGYVTEDYGSEDEDATDFGGEDSGNAAPASQMPLEQFYDSANGFEAAEERQEPSQEAPNNLLVSSMRCLQINNAKNVFDVSNSDVNFNKGSWAGPQHWKIKRSSFLSGSSVTVVSTIKNQNSTASQVDAKKSFYVDFASAAPVDIDMLFSRGSSNLFSITHDPDVLSTRFFRKNLLPLDYKFSSKELKCLFMKPSFSLQSAVATATVEKMAKFAPINDDADTSTNDASPSFDGEDAAAVGAEIWNVPQSLSHGIEPAVVHDLAQQADDDAEEFGGDGAFAQSDSEIEDFGAVDEANFAQVDLQRSQAEIGESSSFSQGAAATSRLLPAAAPISFTKKAKRIDLHRLKECLLAEIGAATDSLDFAHIVPSVAHRYDKAAPAVPQGQVTSAYCFVTLLHVVNESNGRIHLVNTSTDCENQLMIHLQSPAFAK